MRQGNWIVRVGLIFLLLLGVGSTSACSGVGSDSGPKEDCSVYKTKRFIDACNKRNKGKKGGDSTASGRGPCKYGGADLTSDPGVRAKKKLSQELLRSNCVTTSNAVCGAKGDFASGQLNWKAYRQLQRINRAKYKVGISCLWSGHGTGDSMHPLKKGVDLNFVNDQQVNTFGDEVGDFADWLRGQPNSALDFEVGMPPRYLEGEKRTKRSGNGPFFAESEQPHFHFGFR